MQQVTFTPRSLNDLRKMERYIRHKASPRTAATYVDSVVRFCLSIGQAPYRGETRLGLRPGIRTIGFKRRVSIVFSISEPEQMVRIIRILYAGRQAGDAQ